MLCFLSVILHTFEGPLCKICQRFSFGFLFNFSVIHSFTGINCEKN